MMFTAKREDNTLHIYGIDNFSLYRSANCGQAFRWRGENEKNLTCVIGEELVHASKTDHELKIYPCRNDVQEKLYISYFDLDRDYEEIEKRMSQNPVLKRCIPYAGGIRVFNQEPFETLISFIISANNNIKRITGIIDRLCCKCGHRRESDDGEEYYTFPTAEAIAAMDISELRALGLGYRDEYIKRSSMAIADGFSLEDLRNVPYPEAKKRLCTLHGVGGKVADCVLLFSLGHGCAFPMDVWMKRAVADMFFDGRTPDKAEFASLMNEFGEDAGRIQQYIFHYARETELKAERAGQNAQ